ncbi:GTPase IMAP family member 8-like protein [Labeo rohita]|uniref:GTPase IMAP family member 8-like protein n=1 Tax=Labeo rohita TaxID=84645 RepID=A0A498MPX8_LABRO|nr:GTPase IMAP family member 8-like protein [Labeo rohita]
MLNRPGTQGDSGECLRIVLLGVSGGGKSSLGNAILGGEAFKESRTRKSEIQTGRVEDRNISIIDTPGFFNTHLTDEEMKQQMVKSLYLSHPGPHVFLLVINLETFVNDERNVVEQIQKNFGAQALKFTMVLFIGREQMSKREWMHFMLDTKFQMLVSHCRNNYHVINSKNVIQLTHITELLEKIDKIIKDNNHHHYNNDVYLKPKPSTKIRIEKEKQEEKKRNQKNEQKEEMKQEQIKIVWDRFAMDGQENQQTPIEHLVEAGVFDTKICEEQLKKEIVKCVEMSAPGPHVFLLVIRLDVRFTEEEKNTVKWVQENFGEDAAYYTIILFTRGDQLDISIEEFLTKNEQINELVKQCKGGYHVFDNKDKNRAQVTKLLEKIDIMVMENGGQHYTNEMYIDALIKIREEKKKRREEEERKREADVEIIRQEEKNRLKEKVKKAALVGAAAVGGAAAIAGGAALVATGAVVVPALIIAGGAAVSGGTAAEVHILSLLETIKQQQDQLVAKVNYLSSRLNSTPGPDVEMPNNIHFPLENLEAVEAFEMFLKEPSNGPARQKVISSLATIGGQDVKRVTWNILGRLFTDEVSHQINWKGVNNKKPFSRMATKTLLFSAVRKNTLTQSATEAEVTKHAIRWFNLAPDRATRRRVLPPSTQME